MKRCMTWLGIPAMILMLGQFAAPAQPPAAQATDEMQVLFIGNSWGDLSN